MSRYKGCIVEESLEDFRAINGLKIVRVRITEEDNPSERWHIYDSLVSEKEINKLHGQLKQSWYMHFWNDEKIMILFKDKRFEFDIDNKESWKPAIDYGISLGIPKEQLDFEMEFN